MNRLWIESGYHLLDRNCDGFLTVNDDFIRAYLRRSELAPIDESCHQERAFHQALLDDPTREVLEEEIRSILDVDTQENYRLFLTFRDRLLSSGTIESCYLSFFQEETISIPPLFIDNMVHVIMCNLLINQEGSDEQAAPYQSRAGELFFREQSVTINDGAILMADSLTVENLATQEPDLGTLGRMIKENGTQLRSAELDVINDKNAPDYWARSDYYDMVLDATFPREGLIALCRVMKMWIAHFLKVDVRIEPVQTITDERWIWHTGLDKESSSLLNDLYNSEEVEPERMERLLSLFRLDFVNPTDVKPEQQGRPVYMAICMTEGKKLHFKPQNLLFNLSLAQPVPAMMNN